MSEPTLSVRCNGRPGGHTDARPLLSARAYFVWVALLTALGVAAALWLRPSLAYSIRAALGQTSRPAADPGSFYAVRVAPLFQEHCVDCHGPSRHKADLRLDSYEAAMQGGRHGPVILRNDGQHSEILARLRLPPENAKAMPPSGKPPLSADEITVIELWIAADASGVLPVAAIKGAPQPVAQVSFPEINLTEVARQRAPQERALAQLLTRFPGMLEYESRGSADLRVNAFLLGRAFGDRDFALLAPLYGRIVWADLSATSVSDASVPLLSECKRLRVLRIADTAITATSVRTLRGRGIKIHDGRELPASANAAS